MTTKAERSLDRKVQEQKARIEALEDLVVVLATQVDHTSPNEIRSWSSANAVVLTSEQAKIFAEVVENG